MKKNNIRFKAELKFKIKEFIRTLPYHILVMGGVFLVATIFNKYIEAICFLVSFFSLRYKFKTTYHSDSIVICMIITNAMFALSIIICPFVYIYALASIFIAYLDCFLLWYIQDKLECQELLKQFTNKTIWNMSEYELSEYLRCKGIINEKQEFVKLILKGWTYAQISSKLGYSVDTLKDWSPILKKKLKIKSWKLD